MEKISGLVFTKNEENNIKDCLNSLKGVDELYVFDDSSTDKTREIAKELGARVIIRQDEFDHATEQDIKDFEKRFGWKPTFTTETKIPYNDNRNFYKVLKELKNDWFISISADERVKWDLPRIKKEILPIADQVECDWQEHNTGPILRRVYILKKSKIKVVGRTHNTSIPEGRIVHCAYFKIDHYPLYDGKRSWGSRSYVLPMMEFSVLKEDDPRSRFYLGREYHGYARYDEAIKLLNLYLEVATWQPEIQMARIYLTKCYWATQQGDKAREEAKQAVLLNPDSKEALLLMSEVYFEPWKGKWAYIANNATNKDILF